MAGRSSSGLAVPGQVATPLAVVVGDNHGGRIFEHLPGAGAVDAATLERLWLTPPRCDLESAAAAFGVGYASADRDGAIAAALDRGGCTLVHALVEPGDRIYQRVWAELAEGAP